MNRPISGLVITAGALLALGCMSPQGTTDYTETGALVGGLTGAAVGSTTGHAGAGALVGALAGGIIGHGVDQDQQARLRAESPQTLHRLQQGQPLTVEDVKALGRAGVGDDVIISQIRSTGTVYHLATSDIIGLKRAQVSEQVIQFMIQTANQVPAASSASVPPPPPQAEVVPVAPGPGFVWVGGVWVWGGNRWVWRRGYWHRPGYPYRSW